MSHYTRSFASALFLFVLMSVAILGQSSAHPGIDAFRSGKIDEAISLLENAKNQDAFKRDAGIWNTLGLAYIEKKDLKKAQKSFEKAVDLQPLSTTNRVNLAYVLLLNGRSDKTLDHTGKVLKTEPDNYTALYLHGKAALWQVKFDSAERTAERMITVENSDARGYLLKSEVLLSRLGQIGVGKEKQVVLLQDAIDTLKEGISKSKPGPLVKDLEDELQNTSAINRFFSRGKGLTAISTPPAPEPGVTPLKILSKPRPGYTNLARSSNVSGKIIAAVVFGANGKVENVLLIKRLGSGLDEQVIRAARSVTFEPQKENGKAVSVVKLVEYTFEIR